MTVTATTPVGTPAGSPRIGLVQGMRHMLWLAGRSVVKIRKNPDQLIDVTLQPIVMLLLFNFLFGGAIAGGNRDGYLQELVPGVMVFTTLYVSIGTGLALNTDVVKGVFDRFRSLPIPRSAPLVGAVLSDVLRYIIAAVLLLVIGLLMGFRIGTGVVPGLLALLLIIAFGLSLCWVSVFVGMLVRSPSAVPGVLFGFVAPLSFGSSVFVPSQTMPGWLRAWVDINPVTLLTEVNRGLLVDGRPIGGPLLGAVAWMAGFIAVFFPLAMWAYRRRVG